LRAASKLYYLKLLSKYNTRKQERAKSRYRLKTMQMGTIFCFTRRIRHTGLLSDSRNSAAEASIALADAGVGRVAGAMIGNVMKVALSLAVSLAMLTGSAMAADLPVKAKRHHLRPSSHGISRSVAPS
jgi:hypothetical protein